MGSIRQSSVFGSNHVTQSPGGAAGSVLSVGAAAAMVAFAVTVGALVGGAVALGITVLSTAGAGCLLLRAATRTALDVAYWRHHRQLPPREPIRVSLHRQPVEVPLQQLTASREPRDWL